MAFIDPSGQMIGCWFLCESGNLNLNAEGAPGSDLGWDPFDLLEISVVQEGWFFVPVLSWTEPGALDGIPGDTLSVNVWQYVNMNVGTGFNLLAGLSPTGNIGTSLPLATSTGYEAPPNNGPSYSRAQVCAAGSLLNGGVQTALDAVGLIPFANTIVKGAQFVAALGSASLNIFGNGGVAEAGFSGASLSLSTVENAHVMTIGAEAVPVGGVFRFRLCGTKRLPGNGQGL